MTEFDYFAQTTRTEWIVFKVDYAGRVRPTSSTPYLTEDGAINAAGEYVDAEAWRTDRIYFVASRTVTIPACEPLGGVSERFVAYKDMEPGTVFYVGGSLVPNYFVRYNVEEQRVYVRSAPDGGGNSFTWLSRPEFGGIVKGVA